MRFSSVISAVGSVTKTLGSVKKVTSRITHQESKLEKSVREATSNEKWGCPNSLLHEIASASQDPKECRVITKALWQRLRHRTRWRRVLKALTLLEFLLKHGSECAVEEIRRERSKVVPLADFALTQDGKDKGLPVRDRAKAVLQLIGDDELLRSERSKAQQHKDRVYNGARYDVDEVKKRYEDLRRKLEEENRAFGVSSSSGDASAGSSAQCGDPGNQRGPVGHQAAPAVDERPRTGGHESAVLGLALGVDLTRGRDDDGAVSGASGGASDSASTTSTALIDLLDPGDEEPEVGVAEHWGVFESASSARGTPVAGSGGGLGSA